MEGSVGVGTVQEFGFLFPSIVLKESRISDGVDIDMSRGGSSIERVVTGGISSMGEIEVF